MLPHIVEVEFGVEKRARRRVRAWMMELRRRLQGARSDDAPQLRMEADAHLSQQARP